MACDAYIPRNAQELALFNDLMDKLKGWSTSSENEELVLEIAIYKTYVIKARSE